MIPLNTDWVRWSQPLLVIRENADYESPGKTIYDIVLQSTTSVTAMIHDLIHTLVYLPPFQVLKTTMTSMTENLDSHLCITCTGHTLV